MNQNKNFIIKPYKNWISVFFSILILLLSTFILILFILLIYFEKKYILILFIVAIFGISFYLLKELLWIFKGKIILELSETELQIRKSIFGKDILKSYYINEINNVRHESLFRYKMLKDIPIFGKTYFNLIKTFKVDSESIILDYRENEIEIIENLTVGKAQEIIQEIESYIPKK